jgi:ribosomal protein S17
LSDAVKDKDLGAMASRFSRKGRKREQQTQQKYMSKQCKLCGFERTASHNGTESYHLTGVKLVSKTSRGKLGVVAGRVGIHTLAVDVLERHTHKKYGKVFSRTKRYKVQVEESIINSAQKGDKMEIQVCRPLSKTKGHVFDPIILKYFAPAKIS